MQRVDDDDIQTIAQGKKLPGSPSTILAMAHEISDRRAKEAAIAADVGEVATRIIEASEYAQACKAAGQKPADVYVAFKNHVVIELTTLLAAERAKWDAVVRDCRAIVSDRRDAWTCINDSFKTERAANERDEEVERCDGLLTRIDALLGGK